MLGSSTGRASVLIAGVLAACEARQEPEGRVAKAPPFRITPALTSTPASVKSATFSLSDFRPLLTIPELSAVAAALEAGTPGVAARELSNWLDKSPPPPAERFRYDFLLARMHEQAGEFAPAFAAYARVAQGSSPLVDYARIAEARVLLALGRAKEVAAHSARIPDDQPVARLKWPVLAEAARVLGDRNAAIEAYGHVVQALPAGSERAESELRLAGALLDAAAGARAESNSQTLQALALSRRAQNEPDVQSVTLQSAQALEARALGLLPEPLRTQHQSRDPSEQLERVRALVDARRFAEAELWAQQALTALPEGERAGNVACEIQFLYGKALSGRRAYAKAGDAYEALLAQCKDPDLRARAEFVAGKAAASDGQHMLAIKRFAALEQEAPKNSLADDARLLGALSYLELGVEARFTELLSALPDDYPDGDMLAEGCFRLALRRMEKRDFQSAERPLTRAVERLPELEAGRGGEFAGRERYFLARVQVETGEVERGLASYEKLIEELPLGYYVRAAYTALAAADPERAARAVQASAERSASEKPSIRRPPPLASSPGFKRALELAAVGELDWVRAELSALAAESAAPELLFNAAVLYARAGAVKLSSDAARSVLGKAPPRFPAGDWLEAWKLSYPRPYTELVRDQAKKNALPASWVYAVMREESAFDPDAESPADAYGLMQLILPTARIAGKALGLPHDRISLKRPSVNIPLGARVLGKYTQQFPEDPLLAIAAYNAGPGAAKRWLKDRSGASFDLWVELIPYVETRRYIKRVLGSAAVYSIVYEEAEQSAALTLPKAVSG